MSDQKFFDAKQGAAVYKHGILHRYLPPFVSKVGSTSKDGIVYYLDGYAGPGIYNDGSEGSPALALHTAEALKKIRRLQGICVESDTEDYSKLCSLFTNYPDWKAVNSKIEDCLDNLLLGIKGFPLFAFFDPFGLAVPFEYLVNVLNNTPNGPTEILLNFSLSGLRRNAGHLITDKVYKSKKTSIERINKCLGGVWWQDYWRDANNDREEIIAKEYINNLRKAGGGGWRYCIIDIPDRWEGSPSYKLMFLTKHLDGLWLFHNILSSARDDFQKFCFINKTPPFPEDDDWVREIGKNILEILDEKGGFVPKQQLIEIYGNALGKAREKHVRLAINDLYQQGLIIPNPVGSNLPNITFRKPN